MIKRSNKAMSGPLERVRKSIRNGTLVCIAGTGVSLSLTSGSNSAMGWRGLIENGFDYGVSKGKISAPQKESWKQQLASNDIDDLLAAAEFVTSKLDGPDGQLYARWLEDVFRDPVPNNRALEKAIKALDASNIRIATLNYDTLLEAVTKRNSITLAEPDKIITWMRPGERSILHLHGVWNKADTCVLGIRDYTRAITDDARSLVQRSLGAFSDLLFMGCGDTFADPNFTTLIRWMRATWGAASPQHYALVRTQDLAARNEDPIWHGFVEPLSYGDSYSKLPEYIESLLPTVPLRASSLTRSGRTKVDTAVNSAVLDEYRRFLLRDCGEMTIEGIRADMETAQRRFNIERLFVPLSITRLPPEVPLRDPQREEKLRNWSQEHGQPISFGKAFKSHRRLALLALPGGGKSLLLKRLAVAYADPARRKSSTDELPPLDVVPILLRCRDWREHIRSPILEIISNIPTITGLSSLAGLKDALMPLLKKGRVLLLVDGLDEIHDDADRATFVDHLERFIEDYNNVRVVITSREAGFRLVAPTFMRFCTQWTIAPLNEDTITLLCEHWHALMSGPSPTASNEGRDIAVQLMNSQPILRLAENPLLLTMLLVVKHGAGRLPGDRVTLYERAVEVLLDTWNIQGHSRLNPKEAVPQLAFIAFQLMKQGKQTATEREILALIETARHSLQRVRLYAKGNPDEFLKRVELRSSLLVQAGHQMEGRRLVPFYQFRHLTFQEYLASVAIVEGHFVGYDVDQNIHAPLGDELLQEKWRQVVPMAAAMSRKRAEPLLKELISASAPHLKLLLTSGRVKRDGARQADNRDADNDEMPRAVDLLIDCFLEDTEATPDTLAAAFRLISYFANRDISGRVEGLARGPFSGGLLQQVTDIYMPMDWPRKAWLVGAMQTITAAKWGLQHWRQDDGKNELRRWLHSDQKEMFICGSCVFGGVSQLVYEESGPYALSDGKGGVKLDVKAHSEIQALLVELFPRIEDCAFHNNDSCIFFLALWAWHLFRLMARRKEMPSAAHLDRLLKVWHNDVSASIESPAYRVFEMLHGVKRGKWTPSLNAKQRTEVARLARGLPPFRTYNADLLSRSAMVIAFFAERVIDDEELATLIELKLNQGKDSDATPHLFKSTGTELLAQLRKVHRGKRRRA